VIHDGSLSFFLTAFAATKDRGIVLAFLVCVGTLSLLFSLCHFLWTQTRYTPGVLPTEVASSLIPIPFPTTDVCVSVSQSNTTRKQKVLIMMKESGGSGAVTMDSRVKYREKMA